MQWEGMGRKYFGLKWKYNIQCSASSERRNTSLRSKRFRLFSEQKETVEGGFSLLTVREMKREKTVVSVAYECKRS